MTDREALLEAVFAAPADDAPRLVYADWLDEHGEPAQAAFIRAQVALDRIDPDSPDHDRQALALHAVWDRLLDELRPGVPHVSNSLRLADYRRGLPTLPVHLPFSTFRDQSPSWWPRLPIRAVTLDLTSMSVGEFVRIPYLARLHTLLLHGEDPHGMIIPRLVKCHLLQNLRVLDLSQFSLGVEAAGALAATDMLRGLTDLRMPYALRPNRGLARLLRERYGEVCRF